MTDGPEGLHTDEKGNRFLVVSTAKQPPRWMLYPGYLVLAALTYMADDPNGNNWYLYGISGIAGSFIYVTDHLYRAIVSLYNEMRVNNAISVVKGTIDAEKAKVPTLNEITMIDRFTDTLQYIQKEALEIGEARDAAWRALTHNAAKATQEEHADGKKIK